VTRLPDRVTIALTVALLAAYGIARTAVIPDRLHFATNVAMTLVVAAIAFVARLSGDELGVSAAAVPAGLRVGAVAVVVVGVVVTIAILAGGRDSSFVQERASLSAGEMLFQAFVEIPLATVAFEELAFRGVLAPLFHRVSSPSRAVAATALLFGLWHLPPAWDGFGAPLTLVGTLVVTIAAGVALQLMKDRTHSLVAPALAHWATNGLALIVAWSFVAR
jgi:uncharacterized protein